MNVRNMRIMRYVLLLLFVGGMGCDAQSQAGDPEGEAKKPVAATATSSTSWVTMRGDSSMRGVAQGTLADALTRRWRFKSDGEVTSALVVAGRVYFGTSAGSLYCLDMADGKQVWKRPITKADPPALTGAPVYASGNIVVGADNGVIYAHSAKDGASAWQFQTREERFACALNTAPSPDGKRQFVFVAADDEQFYCLDAKTGKEAWTNELGDVMRGAPGVGGDRVIMGGCKGQCVYVLNLADGKEQTTIAADMQVYTPIALDGDQAFFGSRDGMVGAVDLKKKTVMWTYESDYSFEGGPAVTDELVIIGGEDAIVHALNRKTGEKVWTFEARDSVNASPVVVGDKVVVGSLDGRLYVLSLKTGKLLQRLELGGMITASPAVVDGLVIVGSTDGYMYAFGPKK